MVASVGSLGASGDDSGAEPEESLAFAEPAYREAVIDLLGAIGYGEVSAFERLAEDAKLAPTLEDKVAIGNMAAVQLGRVGPIAERLRTLEADPFAVMASFRESFDAFHHHTAPSDWYEGLVKAYVGDGLADDFFREIAAQLDARTRELVLATLEDTGHAGFAVQRIRAGIEHDPRLAGRLALWGRRLMGEALVQAQHVVAERDALSALLAGGVDLPGFDLAAIGRMFTRLTERHAERMTAVGLEH